MTLPMRRFARRHKIFWTVVCVLAIPLVLIGGAIWGMWEGVHTMLENIHDNWEDDEIE